MPGHPFKVADTRSASSTMSCEFSRIGSHSRCLWVRTPSSPFNISYPSSAMPPSAACEPERTVLQTECVCKTAPALSEATTAMCSSDSAEGRPSPRTTLPASSISRNCPAVRLPLSNPVDVIARRSGLREITALKFPLVPSTHPREWNSFPISVRFAASLAKPGPHSRADGFLQLEDTALAEFFFLVIANAGRTNLTYSTVFHNTRPSNNRLRGTTEERYGRIEVLRGTNAWPVWLGPNLPSPPLDKSHRCELRLE